MRTSQLLSYLSAIVDMLRSHASKWQHQILVLIHVHSKASLSYFPIIPCLMFAYPIDSKMLNRWHTFFIQSYSWPWLSSSSCILSMCCENQFQKQFFYVDTMIILMPQHIILSLLFTWLNKAASGMACFWVSKWVDVKSKGIMSVLVCPGPCANYWGVISNLHVLKVLWVAN